MRILAFLCCFFVQVSFVHGQNEIIAERASEEDRFQANLPSYLPMKEKYRYPEFKEGRVFYTTHKQSNIALVNYDLILQNMLMINGTGDTTVMTNFGTIKYVEIEKDLYYQSFGKGYFEIRSNPDDSVQLVAQWHLKATRWILGETEKPEIVNSQNNFSFIYVPRNPAFSRQKVTISRKPIFFLLRKNGEIQLASKAAFFELFPQRKKAIRNYLSNMDAAKRREIFQREEDLKKLLEFCLGQS